MGIVEIVKPAANDSTVRSPSALQRVETPLFTLLPDIPIRTFFLRRYTLSIVSYDIARPCFVKRET